MRRWRSRARGGRAGSVGRIAWAAGLTPRTCGSIGTLTRLRTNSATTTNITAPSATAVRCTQRPRRPVGSTKTGRPARRPGRPGSVVDIHPSEQPNVGRAAPDSAGSAEHQSDVRNRLQREPGVQDAEPRPVTAARYGHGLDPPGPGVPEL